MTKQEILKAIEKGESVWCIYQSHKEIEELYFPKDNDYRIEDLIYAYGEKEPSLTINCDWHYPLRYLFKTKAEAEHYLHHANITRTETLPFLTWGEFLSEKRIKFRSKYNEEYELFIINFKILLRVNGTTNIILSMDLTEANFYKAYDECVRLFRGGE